MSISSKIEGPEDRYQAVAQWFRLARNNAQAADLLGRRRELRTQSLYMTQQSLEAATKGLARHVGLSHGEVKELGHNNQQMFIWLLHHMAGTARDIVDIDAVLSGSDATFRGHGAVDRLAEVLELTASPGRRSQSSKYMQDRATDFFTSMLLTPPDGVAALVDLLDRIDRFIPPKNMLKTISRGNFTFNWTSCDDDLPGSLVLQVSEQLRERGITRDFSPAQLALAKGAIAQFIDSRRREIGEEQFLSEFESNAKNFRLSGKDAQRDLCAALDAPLAFVGILIIGGLVWPHQSYARYIAPPDAPDDILTAAKQRRLGVSHYSDDVGVIRHIRKLNRWAVKISRLLASCQRTGHLGWGSTYSSQTGSTE